MNHAYWDYITRDNHIVVCKQCGKEFWYPQQVTLMLYEECKEEDRIIHKLKGQPWDLLDHT
jgi:uncharacterized protein with PIN domain